MTLAVIGVVIALLLLGQPLFVVLGGLAVACFTLLSPDVHALVDLLDIVGKIGELADKEVLLAIPFFTIAGAIMSAGQISSRLVDVAMALVGWMPGGLAIASVLGCTLFAAISGSSPATVIAIGAIMFPAMVKAQYRENFALGLVTTVGSLGILIPPSIPMIVYVLVKTSGQPIDVGELFLAGVLPGIAIATMLIAYAMVSGWRMQIARQPFSFSRLRVAVRDGFWALMLPVLILGGIYSGLFTETEASAVSVVYAALVEAFIHRGLKLGALLRELAASAQLMGSLLLIMVMAMAFNDYLTDQQVVENALTWVRERKMSVLTFLLLVNGVLLVAGCVMDILSAIILLVPLLAPIAESLGIAPIHLAIIFIVNLELGYMTPPIGLNLFVAASVFRRPFGQVVRAVGPTLIIMLIGVALVTFIPSLPLGLVNVMRGKSFYEPWPSGQAVASSETSRRSKKRKDGKVQATSRPATLPAKKPGERSLQDLTDEADREEQEDNGKKPTPTPKSPPAKKPERSLQDLTDDADDELKREGR